MLRDKNTLICMNAVYKKRKIKPPKNASKKCKTIFRVTK